MIYDRTISKLALQAISNLQAETIAHVEANCLYSEAEEELLATIKSVSKFIVEFLFQLYFLAVIFSITFQDC